MIIMANALAAASRLLIGFGSFVATGSFLRFSGLMTFMASASAVASRAVIEHGSGWLTVKLAAARQRGIGNWSATQMSAYRGRSEVAGRRSKRRF
jgi:hypothetical protein